MGFKRDAFKAGATPKTTPTRADTPKAKDTDQKETDVGKILFMTNAPPAPINIPIIPPRSERTTASMTN